MSNFENFVAGQIVQQLEDIEAVKKALMEYGTVSSHNLDVTIAFSDYDARDLVLDFLTGTQPDRKQP